MNSPHMHLDRLVSDLYKEDPYWSKCLACPFEGKCCNGANIQIFPFEFQIILSFLQKCSEQDKQILKDNLINKKYCPFQLKDRCLIHECRPLNCRWTPFKAQWESETKVNYYTSDNSCNNFTYNITEKDFYSNINHPMIKIKERTYLNLDHFLKEESLFLKDLLYLPELLLNNLHLLDVS